MDINQFLPSLLHSLSALDFVEKVDIHTEAFILKGQAILKKGRFLQVYFNEQTGTIAFALIEGERRVWGIDFDNMRGWHSHPIGNPEGHCDVDSMTLEDIVKALAEAWLLLP
jgi:hypothetical protein